MKLNLAVSLLACVSLYSLPSYAVSQQAGIAPVTVDDSAGIQLTDPVIILRDRVASGSASIADIKRAIKIGKPGDVANVLAATYNMRANPQVRSLLFDMWREVKSEHADLPWDKLQHPVIRTALAAVMNRIAAGTIAEFMDYLHSQADSDIELVRAQVALALGMTGYSDDIPQLKKYAQGESEYVAKSAILGLGYVYNDEAKQTLIDLREQYSGTPRGVYITGMLREAYLWNPLSGKASAIKSQ